MDPMGSILPNRIMLLLTPPPLSSAINTVVRGCCYSGLNHSWTPLLMNGCCFSKKVIEIEFFMFCSPRSASLISLALVSLISLGLSLSLRLGDVLALLGWLLGCLLEWLVESELNLDRSKFQIFCCYLL
jgi:hypothetical protein